MSDEDIGTMSAWANLASIARGNRPQVERSALSQRREEEKRTPLPKTDGRRLRATGRDQQLNLKVSAAVKKQFVDLAASREMGLGEFLEVLMAEWQASGRS